MRLFRQFILRHLASEKPRSLATIFGIALGIAVVVAVRMTNSLTRMPTRGTFAIDGERIEVEGLSWMDHEFGARKEQSIGTIVDAGGAAIPIKFDQFDLEPIEHWESTANGARYPVGWRVQIPGREIELSVQAALDDQELRTSQSTGLIWWQGMMEITGANRGRPVRGRGYLEMTGYAAE